MSAYWQFEEEAVEFDDLEAEFWPEAEPVEWDFAPDVPWPLLLGPLLLAFWLLARAGPTTTWQTEPAETSPPSAPQLPVQEPPPAAMAEILPVPEAFAAPYVEYVITQGLHGQSYGHLAIDLAAGKGAPVLSPINGTVTRVYTDQWGNPTLVIENDLYEVKMLHGIYTVEVGQVVQAGDPVGEESNQGYTTDMRGVPCKGRTDYCGYHTHLNVFSKVEGANVNPLNLIRGDG